VGEILRLLAAGIPATLAVTAGAFAVGVLVALPLTAARRSRSRAARAVATGVVDVLRAVPPVVWLFLIYFGLPQAGVEIPSMAAAIGGLGLIAAAYVAEIYRAGLEAVPDGQYAAADALGLSRWDRLRDVVGPQALLVVVPPLGGYAVGLLKDSAIASTIGVDEVTFRAFTEAQRTLEGLQVFGAAAVIYLVLSAPLALLARWVTARLARRVVVR
jgi:polar amino acid transport system permease protein